jgi:hypothetical protein
MALGLGIRQEKFERLWGLGQSHFTSDFPPYNLNANQYLLISAICCEQQRFAIAKVFLRWK